MDGLAMEGWRDKNAIVTGVNSEIGKGLSQMLLDAGINVIGVDQDEASEKLKGDGNYYYKRVNVSSEDEVWDLFIWIDDNFKGADILINNINQVERQQILDGSKNKWSEMANNNILSYALSGKEFLRSLADRTIEVGHIINISNFYGHRVPLDSSLAFFAATKQAVNDLTNDLRQELELLDSNVKVTSISPRIDPDNVTKPSGVSTKDIAGAVRYALDSPFHLQVYDVVLEPFEEYE